MNNIKEPSLNQDATRLALLLSHHNENLVVHSGTEWEALIDLASKNEVSQMLFTALRTKQITPPPHN